LAFPRHTITIKSHLPITVTQIRTPILQAATLLALSAAASHAQTSAPAPPTQNNQSFYVNQLPKPAPTLYRNLIFLDAAHGGDDTGARLPNSILEKDITLALESRVKALLTAAGFYVVSSHETDTNLTTDQRAEIANHARPAACIILHATSTGSGVHIITSALTPPDDPTATPRILPWDTAQTYTVPQSLRVANLIGLALVDAKLPTLLTRATVRPLDNLTCPAVAIELAPLVAGSSSFQPSDSGYQQRAAQAIATALTTWRTRNAPPPTQPTTGAPR
jgi:N-acetylmuramoyl-L-alanine amidase